MEPQPESTDYRKCQSVSSLSLKWGYDQAKEYGELVLLQSSKNWLCEAKYPLFWKYFCKEKMSEILKNSYAQMFLNILTNKASDLYIWKGKCCEIELNPI